MKRKFHYRVWYCLLLVIPFFSKEQVLAKASVDRDSILIGEPIKLTLDVRFPLGADITWFKLDTIPHFEFLDKGKTDTSSDMNGKEIVQVLTLTSFDSGHFQIPALILISGNKKFSTDSIGIDVAYASTFNQSQDYRDIHDIVEVPKPSWLRYIPWIIGIVTLIAIAVLVFVLTRSKKVIKLEQPVASKLPPYEEALQALQELRKKGWALDGQVKPFYSSLNDILRIFVLRKLNIATLEKTNEELIMQLRKLSMDKEIFHQLAEALRIADFVKFAKYEPVTSDNEKNFMVVQSAINSLNNINVT
jgi:hypothetical protein